MVQNWSAGRDEARARRCAPPCVARPYAARCSGRPPYGYHVGPRNRLELVEEEALVVRYIYRLYLHEGLGIRLIARRLNEEGLRTRRNRPLEHGQHPRHPSQPRLPRHLPAPRHARAGQPPRARRARRLPPRAGAASRTGAPTTRRAYVSGFLLSGMVVCEPAATA